MLQAKLQYQVTLYKLLLISLFRRKKKDTKLQSLLNCVNVTWNNVSLCTGHVGIR